MMLATVRVLIERAEGARFRLVDLASAVPEELLSRRGPGDDWPVRTHLGHAFTSDGPVKTLVDGLLSAEADCEALFEKVMAERASAIASAQERSVEELMDLAGRERHRLISALARVQPAHLELTVTVPGVRDAWGRPVVVSLVGYLQAWCQHDLEHETAIREAIQTTPDLAAVALVQRRRR
jgi:hypothetical protein